MKDNKTDEKTFVVYCHTTPDGMQYYGMSCNVKARWRPSQYKGTSLVPYIEQFGWVNITHEVLYENLTHEEALKREDSLIVEARNNGTCINTNRSGHYKQTDEFKEEEKARSKVYREAHPEEMKAYNKAYREAHPEEGSTRSKAYREAHPEEIKAYNKAYYEAHPEECKARSKAYYEANKDKINARRREKRRLKKEQNKKPPPPIF